MSFLTSKKSCITCPNWEEGGRGKEFNFFPVRCSLLSFILIFILRLVVLFWAVPKNDEKGPWSIISWESGKTRKVHLILRRALRSGPLGNKGYRQSDTREYQPAIQSQNNRQAKSFILIKKNKKFCNTLHLTLLYVPKGGMRRCLPVPPSIHVHLHLLPVLLLEAGEEEKEEKGRNV